MLLGKQDPHPVELVGSARGKSGLLICEHAGCEVPESLKSLGLSGSTLRQHIAYDIGAEATARQVAEKLDTPLLIQRYSRLVIDCNRPPDAVDSIPAVSDGTNISGNSGLSAIDRDRRVKEIFTPFDNAVSNQLDENLYKWTFSIHSFTPVLGSEYRPWDIGFLFRKDTDTSARLAAFATREYPLLNIGLNQPYQIDDESDWFIPRHAERLGLPHSLIEIRNDNIDTPEGQQRWATMISAMIQHAVSDI